MILWLQILTGLFNTENDAFHRNAKPFFLGLLHFLLIPLDPLNHVLNTTFEAQYHVQCLRTKKKYFCTFFTILLSAKTEAFCKNQQIDVSSFTLRDSKLLHSLSDKNK